MSPPRLLRAAASCYLLSHLRRPTYVAAAALALSSTAPALAQSDSETAVARQRFKEGVAHYDQGNFDKARLAFLQAYALKPHPAILMNLAQSELRGGRFAEAATNFAKYIRENPGAQAMEHARSAFQEARQKVTEVNVRVNLPEAILMVDGVEVARSPLAAPLYVMPGAHVLSARKGRESAEQVFQADAGGEAYVTLELKEDYPEQAPPSSGPSRLPSVSAGAEMTSAGEEPTSALPTPHLADSKPGFVSWLGSNPGAIATVTAAGLSFGASAILAGFANGRYQTANGYRDDFRDKLMAEQAYLLPGSLPCGTGGVEGGERFVPGIAESEEERLVEQFTDACRKWNNTADRGDQLKTLSLSALGLGAAAAVGTVAWYFLDTRSGSSGHSTQGGSHGYAHLSPVLTQQVQGLWLNVAF